MCQEYHRSLNYESLRRVTSLEEELYFVGSASHPIGYYILFMLLYVCRSVESAVDFSIYIHDIWLLVWNLDGKGVCSEVLVRCESLFVIRE